MVNGRSELPPKSKAILDRALLHKGRCLQLAFALGENAADKFHLKHKCDPASDRATEEFEQLISAAGN